MTETLQVLIDQQEGKVEALKKSIKQHEAKIAAVSTILAQGNQELNALVADTIKEVGYLEGLKAASAALDTKGVKDATG